MMQPVRRSTLMVVSAFVAWLAAAESVAATLSALSTTSAPKAARLKLTGAGFGASQASSVVMIGGASAPVSRWSDTQITAYVPEGSALGSVPVSVVVDALPSNSLTMVVSDRVASGRVRWRLQTERSVRSRSAVAPDGTVLVLDLSGTLYAVTPSGGVKWITRPVGIGQNPVAVGADGVAYVAGDGALVAINPDGTEKWRFIDTTGSFGAGPGVGPDGNIYAVSETTVGGGMGALILSPSGQRLYSQPGYRHVYGTAGLPREITFGSGQWYFQLGDATNTGGALQALQLGGGRRWAVQVDKYTGAAAIGPDGRVYVRMGAQRIAALSPSTGAVLNTFNYPNNLNSDWANPDVGSDGSVYVAASFGSTFGLTATLTQKWSSAGNSVSADFAVSPNASLAVYTGYNLGSPGRILAHAPTGTLKWTESLPSENGGNMMAASRPRFSNDSATVYVGTSTNDYATDPYGYLYALATGASTSTSLLGD
ncbi:PQQ-binding-like beta-propeller repeat protein [Archangium sp.]|uniref:outer membrane protein assembly factor BamB family protein n=1 Tax=Archangium sp. TaxID=1872627 RepID=UPI002D7297A8|nr:PQQ-binding-like beta-propeller repeat protein [Archangium sp.]HYO53395.1 PQQ-binding-like beta-propeller repeat protein [Archangium sp.]